MSFSVSSTQSSLLHPPTTHFPFDIWFRVESGVEVGDGDLVVVRGSLTSFGFATPKISPIPIKITTATMMGTKPLGLDSMLS